MNAQAAWVVRVARWVGLTAVFTTFASLFLPFARINCTVCLLAIFLRPFSGSLLGGHDGTALFVLGVAALLAWGLVMTGRRRQRAAAVSLLLALATLALISLDADQAWSRVVGWNTAWNPVGLEVGLYVSLVGTTVTVACAGIVVFVDG